MQKRMPINLLSLLLVSVIVNGWANDNDLSLSYGQPTTSQNKRIASIDVVYERKLWATNSDQWAFGISGKLGHLSVDDESGTRLGGGAFARYHQGGLWLQIPIGVVWMDKVIYGEHQRYTKHYGGEVQFTYGIEAGYRLTPHLGVFYRYGHMSNGNRYHYNPALNSHNIGIKWAF
ncbi:acyloxyacyl hydrolase [Shewanella sp. NIFS-20-20]|uniref:acyloxyacyl hydrolase n=1 Tax=Shewanella sp. NIFS-20-20 TaxID=2853806 RepID=UPI001C479238|nr:acyloxyacyl hydrolase [Shewanella sp. NIFS-20-20]MBV7316273.1 acyloxyacyl hydrolase [Shewanella sp. NIFS-20-20]